MEFFLAEGPLLSCPTGLSSAAASLDPDPSLDPDLSRARVSTTSTTPNRFLITEVVVSEADLEATHFLGGDLLLGEPVVPVDPSLGVVAVEEETPLPTRIPTTRILHFTQADLTLASVH